ncbi:MAG: hypothetical protein ACRD0Y_09140 [Terriglobales bacterium]
MARRRLYLTIVAACIVAMVAVSLWWALPPSIVRRLPPGQTLVYVNTRPLRDLDALSGPAQRSSAYQAFVRESGFDFQHDLDAMALSLQGSPTAPASATVILRGRFGSQFTAYLRQHALRQERIHGADAYVFPGWTRPQQLLTVLPLGAHEVLITNRKDAEPVIAHAQRWWPAGPALWRAGNNWRMLAGYADCNTEQLEAARALDGSAPPWQGVERIAISLRGQRDGLLLAANAEATTTAAAIAAADWVQTELHTLRPLLPERPGQPTLRALLDRLQTGQQERHVWLRLHVDRATLEQWTRALQ